VTDSARRLGELAERWALGASQVAALAGALELLRLDPLAPSSVRGADAVDVHVADSLSALALEAVARATAIADLGSGSGFPGLVLAVALPGARVALVESAARRCEFLERLRLAAGAQNAYVVRARVEEWAAGAGAAGRRVRVRGAAVGARRIAGGLEGGDLGGRIADGGPRRRAARAASLRSGP
jgi:16S rRNA (guanine527-N7)-methyltransferase